MIRRPDDLGAEGKADACAQHTPGWVWPVKVPDDLYRDPGLPGVQGPERKIASDSSFRSPEGDLVVAVHSTPSRADQYWTRLYVKNVISIINHGLPPCSLLVVGYGYSCRLKLARHENEQRATSTGLHDFKPELPGEPPSSARRPCSGSSYSRSGSESATMPAPPEESRLLQTRVRM